MKRGDVVIVDWPLFRPLSTGQKSKPRPALIIQNDVDNARLTNTILAIITSVTRRSMEPTQLLINTATPEGKQPGLRQDSVVNCVNLLTIEQSKILHIIGSFPPTLMQQVDDCLKTALELP
ncbi:MAG TPA: type II toxin-antitoxin system PemK/MazF family toxin [Gemmataceae bacterium]|nr:type II toxin-antitoxin system PemK/MazF family toxin [Gemmataceae bacterium]